MKAERDMNLFETLVDGAAADPDKNWNGHPWEVSSTDPNPDNWRFVQKSEKQSARKGEGEESGYDEWEAYYTNHNPYEFPGGGPELADCYRLRWGIETNYRVLKELFLPKSATSMREQRVFIFNYAVLLQNTWLAANVRKADRTGTTVKDDNREYHYTASEFMASLLDDQHDLDVGEVADFSEISDVVVNASEFDLND